MIGLALLLQVSGSAGAVVSGARTATVGDTIWVTRTVQVAPRQTVRPVEWKPEDPVEAVGEPRVTTRGTTVEIQYPLTVWRAGQHRIEIPGPLVLGANGSADSLPPEIVTLDIKSVLPAAAADSNIAPQPRANVVPRRTESWGPLAVLLALAALVLLPLRVLWWRRGKPAVPSAALPPAVTAVPVERWAAAGERRAVASLAAARLRASLARRAADLPPNTAREMEELLGALDRTRFGSIAEDDALALFRRAAQLDERIGRDAT